MNPVEPTIPDGATSVVFARDQPEYRPLPGAVDADGVVMTEWEPTTEELECLMLGGRVRIWTYTFNRPLQPLRVEAVEAPCPMDGR